MRTAHSDIVPIDLGLPRGDVVAVDGALEDGEGGQGLVVGDFVAGVVDTGEGEGAALLCLAVDDEVGGQDVDVAWGGGGAGDADGVVDGFAAEPVAWVFETMLAGSFYHILEQRWVSTYYCSLRLRISL